MKKTDRIVYGPAEQGDLPAVVELCMLVEEQHEGYWPLRWERRAGLPEGYLGWMRKRLGEPRFLIQVAKEEGKVVGMIVATILEEIPIYTFKEYAMVQDLAVVEGYRRRGISQRLLADAAAWAKGQGVNQLRLMVAAMNPGARQAFEKAGFVATYQEMVLPLE